MRTNKMPKTVQRWIDKHQNIIEEVEVDDENFEPETGIYSIWVHLNKGWINSLTDCHSIHEPTAKSFLESASFIKKCECADCNQQEKTNE